MEKQRQQEFKNIGFVNNDKDDVFGPNSPKSSTNDEDINKNKVKAQGSSEEWQRKFH